MNPGPRCIIEITQGKRAVGKLEFYWNVTRLPWVISPVARELLTPTNDPVTYSEDALIQFTTTDSNRRLVSVPLAQSTSAQLLIYECAGALPSYDLPAVNLVPLQLDGYHRAVPVQRPVPQFMDASEDGSETSGSEGNSKWSDAARKRYERYKRSWKKYRITKQI
ncbi:hypothetical protein Y032_0230g2935 [Ancylostoma ceylanicum]|uniref:Uncharacterized protein n=1 Tax=Ancylostoma ceylanicum TaxID=53326 RepID=A0A016SFN8_9BILA|nr:hypothetical protein Y032_0230g2935 [Ancylostoma ceylanicum]